MRIAALHGFAATPRGKAGLAALHFTCLSHACGKIRALGNGRKIPMADVALPGSIEPALTKGPELDKGFHPLTGVIYLGVVAAALLFVAYSIYSDVDATGTKVNSLLPYLLLFVALLIALGFEFVNGFHDTANAVAPLIYTRSLPAHI